MTPTPLILSPALPSELLAYIVQYESHPTTLLICCPRADFLSSLIADVQQQQQQQDSLPHPHPHPHPPHPRPDNPSSKYSSRAASASLLSAPLYQVAIARHIRMVFLPTVSHLRAYLSVFSPSDSKVVPPPPAPPPSEVSSDRGGKRQRRRRRPPLLLVYGFLGLHRDTSEWSAQGISASAVGIVEAARRSGFGAVVVDAPLQSVAAREGEEEAEEDFGGERGGVVVDRAMLEEEVPVLSASVVRAGGEFEDAAWTGRKVSVDRVLGRWFRYKEGDWPGETIATKENST